MICRPPYRNCKPKVCNAEPLRRRAGGRLPRFICPAAVSWVCISRFLDPGVTTYGYRYYQGKWDYGPSILNPPVDAAGHFLNSLDLGRAVASDVQLLPREFLPASKRQQLLVAVSALDLQMGKRKLRLEPGEVLWLEGREAELVNASNNAARFAVVELKAASEQY